MATPLSTFRIADCGFRIFFYPYCAIHNLVLSLAGYYYTISWSSFLHRLNEEQRAKSKEQKKKKTKDMRAMWRFGFSLCSPLSALRFLLGAP
jgi:hypothetical protein